MKNCDPWQYTLTPPLFKTDRRRWRRRLGFSNRQAKRRRRSKGLTQGVAGCRTFRAPTQSRSPTTDYCPLRACDLECRQYLSGETTDLTLFFSSADRCRQREPTQPRYGQAAAVLQLAPTTSSPAPLTGCGLVPAATELVRTAGRDACLCGATESTSDGAAPTGSQVVSAGRAHTYSVTQQLQQHQQHHQRQLLRKLYCSLAINCQMTSLYVYLGWLMRDQTGRIAVVLLVHVKCCRAF